MKNKFKQIIADNLSDIALSVVGIVCNLIKQDDIADIIYKKINKEEKNDSK